MRASPLAVFNVATAIALGFIDGYNREAGIKRLQALAPVTQVGAFSLLALRIKAAQTQWLRRSTGESMLRKLCIFAAVAAAMFIAPAAFAGHGHGHKGHGHKHGHHKHGHHYHGHVRNNWDDRINWNAPLRGRWWGGRWYGYGEGACWRWSPGGYVWICH